MQKWLAEPTHLKYAIKSDGHGGCSKGRKESEHSLMLTGIRENSWNSMGKLTDNHALRRCLR